MPRDESPWFSVPLLELDPTHEPHAHVWVRTSDALGCVGQLYPNVYPHVCHCGALRKFDGTVLPGRLT